MPTAPPIPAPAPFTTSAILQPSLDGVKHSLSSVRVDKWKRGTVRDEAADDINSIQREIQEHLPPLMQDADTAQGALSKTLPVATHVDALYDVLLRVLEAARIAAPDDQAATIRQALNSLSGARLALNSHILERATAQEKQVSDLHSLVEKQAAFKCPAPPPAPVCPKAPPAKKTTKKPAATAPKMDSTAPDSTKPSSTEPASSATQGAKPAGSASKPASTTTPPKPPQ